jgi:hypothetical protein
VEQKLYESTGKKREVCLSSPRQLPSASQLELLCITPVSAGKRCLIF